MELKLKLKSKLTVVAMAVMKLTVVAMAVMEEEEEGGTSGLYRGLCLCLHQQGRASSHRPSPAAAVYKPLPDVVVVVVVVDDDGLETGRYRNLNFYYYCYIDTDQI